MSDEAARAQKESAAAVARRKASPRQDLHEQERQRAMDRYLGAELYAEQHEEAHTGAAQTEPIDKTVRARRQHDAATRMRRQVAGADEVPRKARDGE